jgi:hypothetical protein
VRLLGANLLAAEDAVDAFGSTSGMERQLRPCTATCTTQRSIE